MTLKGDEEALIGGEEASKGDDNSFNCNEETILNIVKCVRHRDALKVDRRF